jgi:Fe-S oxidoreductase
MSDAHRDRRKLLTPHVRAIGRPAGPAQDDAVDPGRVEGTPAALKNDLIELVGQDQVLHRVAEAVINTIPAPAVTTVAWIVLPSISEAAALVPGLVAQGAEAVELMLAPALAAAAQAFPGTPAYWRDLDPGAAALLVELGASSPAGLDAAEAKATALAAGANLVHPVEFTQDEDLIELYWRVRDGLLGIVGQRRPEGTALVIEDVCFPPDRVAEGAQDLQELLSKHSFLPNTAGHAAYGNLHFTLTPRLADPGDRERYAAFMADLVTLVIDKYDGSLKAEHGTGINMAPFVRHEWGDKATDMMWRIKQLADPHGVLAPNVILTRDDGINLKSFKSAPPIEDVAVHCIECGFCEAVCPSRNVTTTPRQRISDDLIPSVPGPMPRAQLRKLPSTTREGAAAVYFPACVNRIFGRDPSQARLPSLPQVLVEVSARAGQPLWIPGDVAGKCCSTPWSSKGYLRGHKWMAATTCDALWEWSGHGAMPVVIDAASCTNGLLDDVKNYLDDEHRARLDQITLLDSIAWCDRLLPKLTIARRVERAAVHPTCSSTHLGLTKTLERLVGRLADEVLVPVGTTCCGTAGDRGLLHPELVISATRDEKAGLDKTPAQAYLSANRTCEMGLRQATGYRYESFVFLLEELTRPA